MSDPTLPQDGASRPVEPPPPPPPPPPTAPPLAPAPGEGPATIQPAAAVGEQLRAGRVAHGMTVEALAAMLKVPARRIEALEAGRFDELPDAVFARALASSVCRALKLDPVPLLSVLPHHASRGLPVQAEGLNAQFPASGADMSLRFASQVSRKAMWVVGGLLLAALLVWLAPPRPSDAPGVTPKPTAANSLDKAPVTATAMPSDASADKPLSTPASVAAPAPGGNAVSAPGGPAAPSPSPSPATAVPAVVPANSVPLSTPALPPVMAAASSAGLPRVASTVAPAIAVPRAASNALPVAASGASVAAVAVERSTQGAYAVAVAPAALAASLRAAEQTVSLKSKGSASWIEVSDGNGAVVLRRTLFPGEVAGVTGPAPLKVVVGRADVTEVMVRGKPMDLAAIAKEGVARFEVK